MRCTYSLDIHAPAEKVFDLIRDRDKHPLWLKGVEETRPVGDYDADHPVGAKFKQRIREGGRVKEYDGEITDCDRPNHFGIRLSDPSFSVQVDYRLTPTGAGSRLDYAAVATCSHWFLRLIGRLIGWLVSFFMKRALRRQLTKLKELAERGG